MTEEAGPSEKARTKDVPLDLKPYFLGLLRKGERWNNTQDAESADLMPRQLAYLRQQVEAGRYRLAGPIVGDGPLVGLLIIAANSAREAQAIASADPGVQSGRLSIEIHPTFLPSLDGLKINYR